MNKEFPSQINNLIKFLEKGEKNIAHFSSTELERSFTEALKYLNDRYIFHFGKKKNYSDEHIAEIVFEYFIKEASIKQYLMCSWQGVEKSLSRASMDISKLLMAEDINAPFISSELNYFKDLAFDIVLFLDYAESKLNDSHNGYGYVKRNIANSLEAFHSSVDHIRHRLKLDTFSNFIRQPISAFLIRQSIELRIKNALGINIILDRNGNPLKLNPEVFIEFIYHSKSHINVPVKQSILKKIHNWTNYYIHGGLFLEVWKIDFAQHLLAPLFRPAEKPGAGCSAYGSIEINKQYFENEIEREIKEFICSKCPKNKSPIFPDDIYLIKMRPEALLV